MRLQFLGAAGEVTGSCYLFETNSTKLLIDCGMFQGSENAAKANSAIFAFNPSSINALLVTHAHLDHSGRIPKLVRDGFRNAIYTTKPSADLMKLIWEDTVHIMNYEHKKTGAPILFDENDKLHADALLNGVDYEEKFRVGDIECCFHEAGHILGSAWLEIIAEGKSIVFSGDLGNVGVPVVHEKTPYDGSDVLVIEATYGDSVHEAPKGRVEQLKKILTETIEAGGVLMIPAFSLERTQELLYELNYLIDECKCIAPVPIFLDSPLSIRATDVYKKFSYLFDKEALRQLETDDDLFNFTGLRKTLSSEESKTINDVPAPKIIISGNGMLSGGRILHHLIRYLSDPKSTLLLVSYQAPGTLGHSIKEGAKSVKIWNETVQVRARVAYMGSYSGHADARMLVDWVEAASHKPSRVYITHADPPSATAFATKLQNELDLDSIIPKNGDAVEF